ncbi:Rne/Rng family ribonuclease [Nocardia panacis]|uniref:Ribonuclease E n=1 Tax=Nocardia panacis TaxID=2340916 RepID=A0A3A4K5W2_9NOCA|nr:translation initiation factor IF-2 N-terminal domain-containing protein [Nocardia panacis]RJO69850.1 Rne/Rng family ribonuclease [Nocardia panacis]
MADQEPLDTTKQDAEQLPERIRVHALAKLLGTTSKRVLAKLSELGAEARSAQSNVDRAFAASVVDALGPRASETSEQPPAPAEVAPPAEPAPAEPEAVVEVVAEPEFEPQPEAAAVAEPGIAAGPLFAAARPEPEQLFTSAVQEAPHVAEPIFQSAVVAPLFLPPDAAVAEEARRRRKAEREARRAERPAPEPVEEEQEPVEDEADNAEHGEDSEDHPRRRRRGRRGRGRGRGEQQADAESDEDTEGESAEGESAEGEDVTSTESVEPAQRQADEEAADADDDSESDGSSRRRRRRRRRKVAGESGESEPSDDDPPNTVVHEREPRNKSRSRAVAVDEVQGITGSTRLEAKRQRRRDGREAGRRRPPILTESEFLARREAVDRVMVVREKSFPDHAAATQVAVLEDSVLVEHFVTNTGSASMVGNVYLGRVQNVLPSMEAAFVDIGRGRNGVLYAGEVNWEAAGLGGRERKIEQALRPGDQVLVQVSKDPVGHKGARLTTQISLAGRFLVYVPGGTSTGISRKLPDTERKRLKEILRDIVPADAGVIIRTASEGVSETELARDVERLQATWRTIEKAAANRDSGSPKTLYEEPDLLVKVIRDLFNEDFSRLVIEGDRAWSTVETYIRTVAPDLLARVSRHDNNGVDVFETYRIDEQLAKALDRKVWLPSGGTLVIDRTEAMTVIDVNTGKFTGSGGSNLEETVTRNNLEAAEEIVRQMRLRDIGGMIVVDFIDMVLESNRDLVLRRLTEALGRDRTRHQVSEVTSLGLVQMTRKKLGTGLVEAFSSTCEHCHGRGIIVHTYPVEPAAVEEGAARTRETGSRRRRGRDKSAAPAEPVVATNGTAAHGDSVEEDAAVKRAHPVALAMAAHLVEEPVHGEAVAAGDDSVETESVLADSADTVSDSAGAEVVESRSESGSRPVETGVVVAEADSTRVEAGRTPKVTESGAVETVSVSAPEPEPAHRNGTARRRRVARSTAAPAADSAGAVFVLSAEQQPAAPIDYVGQDAVEVPHRARPRRRAVGRPAGAPEAEA